MDVKILIDYKDMVEKDLEQTKRDILDMIDLIDALSKVKRRYISNDDPEPIEGYFSAIQRYRDNARKTLYKLISKSEEYEKTIKELEYEIETLKYTE